MHRYLVNVFNILASDWSGNFGLVVKLALQIHLLWKRYLDRVVNNDPAKGDGKLIGELGGCVPSGNITVE